MIYTIILIILSIGLIVSLFLAGHANAVMDCISWHDSIKYKWGEHYSRDKSESNKDRNHDGKISFMESAAPNDGWHQMKREMTTNFKLAMICSIVIGFVLFFGGFSHLFITIYFGCFLIVIFSVFGLSFSYHYDRMKLWKK